MPLLSHVLRTAFVLLTSICALTGSALAVYAQPPHHADSTASPPVSAAALLSTAPEPGDHAKPRLRRISGFGPEQRQRLYEQSRLSHTEALWWSLLWPGGGNFYANQYFLGALHATLGVSAAMVLGYGLSQDVRPPLFIGGGVFASSLISGLATSQWGVREANAERRGNLKVSNRAVVHPLGGHLAGRTANLRVGWTWMW